MKTNFITKHKGELTGVGIGALLGFSYYYFIGCQSGNCMISSNPFISTGYGALMGYFVTGLFKTNKNENS